MSVFVNPITNELFGEGEQMTTRQTFMNTLIRLANATNPVDEFYNNGSTAIAIIKEFQNNGTHSHF
jgi:hypothetical protein